MKKIFRILMFVLLLHVATQLPWRLAILGAEAAIVHPNLARMSQDNEWYWDAMSLEAKLVEVGYTVKYIDGLERTGFYGMTIWSEHTVFVEKSLHWNNRYMILAHEAGHVLSPVYLRGEPEREVFAEAVASLVCRCGYRENARYLASVRGSLSTLFWYSSDIYRVAAFLR